MIGKKVDKMFSRDVILVLVAGFFYMSSPMIVTPIITGFTGSFGYACCSVSMSTWLSMLLPKEKIGSGMGIYGTVQALGMAVAPSFGIKVQSILGYRAVFSGRNWVQYDRGGDKLFLRMH